MQQLQLILTPVNGRRYTMPSFLRVRYFAYHLQHRKCYEIQNQLHSQIYSRIDVKLTEDSSFEKPLDTPKQQQRITTILLDEMKLKEAMRLAGWHATYKQEELAASALVMEVVCHYGGPRYVLRIIPVSW